MKKFFKTVWNRMCWPFIALTILRHLRSAKSKAREYLHNPELFTKVERYDLAYKACNNAVKLFNIQITTKGFESVPKRPVLFVGNHKSEFDPILMIKVLFEHEGYPFFNFVAKKEIKKDKFGANVSVLIDSIFVDRQNLRQLFQAVEQTKVKLAENSVIVFPEGTRIKGDKIGEMKSSILDAAYKAIVPIVPFVIYGSDKCKHEGQKKPNYQYKDIVIEFLPQIKPKDYINTNREFLMEKIQKQIAKRYDELKIENKVVAKK